MKDSIIQKAREIPIADVLQKINIPFQIASNQIKIRCPWHEEYEPSFVIYDNNWGHCFGCGINKDSIDIIRELLNLSFVDAVDLINSI